MNVDIYVSVPFILFLFFFNVPGLIFIVAAISLSMETSPFPEGSRCLSSFVITIQCYNDNGL